MLSTGLEMSTTTRHEKAMEQMHGQAAHRLSFNSCLPHNIGNERESSSHMEQMDHVIESYVPSVII
jgi:hypothetical protein